MIEIAPASPYAFGASLQAKGDVLLVGAPYRDYAGRVAGGESIPPPSAALYARTAGGFRLVGQRMAAAPLQAEGFARSVALSDDGLAVGAPGHENGDGPVHTFDLLLRPGPLFDSPDRPRGFMTDLLAEYGAGLAVDEDHVFVGAPLQGDAGAVYVYGARGTTTLRGATAREGFGRSLAVDGDFLVIGADGAYSSGKLAGACYVYRRDGAGDWVEHCRVDGTTPGEQLGFAVAIDGHRFAVGAPGRAGVMDGRVDVYAITNDGSRRVATFRDAASFGSAVALADDRLAIGQPMYGADQLGRVALVRLQASSTTWLAAPSAKRFARLGASVALGPDYVAAGMPGLGKDDAAGRVLVEAF